mmetsp:Transcript_130388/g.194059  ORF Transcript_130388/g.194059 Transcript_130388/m.194059 type:complete len:218 (-) Transcript_130388:30-683(-)
MREALLGEIKENGLKSVTPEQKRALQVLLRNWPSAKDIRANSPLPSFFPTGFTRSSASVVSVENLPCGENWIWRQCNAKVSTKLDDITTVIIQKFNTRDKKTTKGLTPKRPTYKLWNLRVLQNDIAFSFLFCERGVDLTPVQPQKISYPSNTYRTLYPQIPMPYYYIPVNFAPSQQLYEYQNLPVDPSWYPFEVSDLSQTLPGDDSIDNLLGIPHAI